MASPWLALLKNVPWIDVIRNATAVADGARKLWDTVRGQPTLAERTGRSLASPAAGADPDGLDARLAAAERGIVGLQQEMLASSELIRNLADQNTLLVARLDANRVRTLWLTGALAAVGAVAVLALLLVLAR